jgi:PiT family inorganic phosphate transporter
MPGLETIPLVVVAFYIAWGIGANDETMMIAASGSSVSVRNLAIIGAIVTCIGAIVYGEVVEKTIGQGLLTIPVNTRIGLIIVTATALWLTVISWSGWPISTSHSTIGAVIGYSIFAGGVSKINWQSLNIIFLSWVLSPLIGLAASYILVRILDKRIPARDIHSASPGWLYGLLGAALLQEFWQGANNVSNATAFLSATFEYPIISRTLGGVALAIGLVTLGRRVLTAAGTRITRIPIYAALATQVVIVVINAVGTIYGIPLSGTHLSVGCLVGAGLGCNAKVDYKMCGSVILYWLITLPGSALFSIVTAYISTLVFP